MKRALAAFALAVLAGCGGGGTAPTEKAQARIAITFDVHRTTYPVAFPMMRERGIPGTYFVEPQQIDATLAGELRELQAAGWTIGAYSGLNMRNLAENW
jgi:peptidoglycan/xylan/chitin deacetylase (PgdA/CDA1 family)